jgi:hypothetical protein
MTTLSSYRIVIPAKAGIQSSGHLFPWTPAFAGVTKEMFARQPF